MEHRIVGMISHLAAMLPVATGFGLASQLKGEGFVACAFVGEGATREGDFHEALNLAAVWKLPVLFVVENNRYGLSTPTNEAMAVEDIADAAAGYAMAGEVVDGNDVLAVIDAVTRAADRGRAGEGPTLLEMKTFRMRGHEEASGTKYVPDALFDTWSDRDPLLQYRNRAVAEGWLSEEGIAQIDAALSAEIEEVAEWAIRQPDVESDLETERAALFAPSSVVTTTPEGGATEKRFIDAVQDGLRQAMEADDRVVLMGQDVAEYGGVFKVTQGFVEQFGKARIRNTPIIESGALGCAMGLALEGFRPVVEMQYADFITCGFNQIVNNLGTTHYRWNEPLNVTIRAPFGGGIGAGPFHSQSPEAWFAHAPGLKVVIPGTPADAKGLLMASIEDPNPVLFFEHKHLYRSLKGDVPDAPYTVALGEANVVREGADLTLVTWGVGVQWAIEEAAHWAERGAEIELVDLRTLVPWDRATVLRSLAKTNRLARAPRGAADGRLRRRSRRPTHRRRLRAPRRAAGPCGVRRPPDPVLEGGGGAGLLGARQASRGRRARARLLRPHSCAAGGGVVQWVGLTSHRHAHSCRARLHRSRPLHGPCRPTHRVDVPKRSVRRQWRSSRRHAGARSVPGFGRAGSPLK